MTFLLLVEAFDRILPHLLVRQMRILLGVFRTFPRGKKSAASAAVPRPSVPASVSSWTRAAYEDLDSADEPATQQDEDEELLFEEEEDPSGWRHSKAASGRPFYWHRSSRRSVWHLPLFPSSAEEEEVKRTRLTFARRRLRQLHMLGWFGWLLLALCSLLLSTGPRCSASWPVCTRRTVARGVQAIGLSGSNSWSSVVHVLRQSTDW